jgi:hypothetical protein
MDALPEGVVIDVETPVASNQRLSPAEQARLALSATQRFLAAWQGLKSGVSG